MTIPTSDAGSRSDPDEDSGLRESSGVPAYRIVIPARYASSRFPGKPLVSLNGRAMLLHVVDRARESQAASVIVATDDARIVALCQQHDVPVQITRADHPSGTDRIAELAETLAWPDDTLIVGLQGDEPATLASHLDKLAANLASHSEAHMASLCMPAAGLDDYVNPNRVKVVRDRRGMALYFSRAPIPHRRDPDAVVSGVKSTQAFPACFIHVGLYAYRCGYLKRYGCLTPALIEQEESLEQLRVLYHGGRIHVDEIPHAAAHGVDHPDDVPMIEAVLREQSGAARVISS